MTIPARRFWRHAIRLACLGSAIVITAGCASAPDSKIHGVQEDAELLPVFAAGQVQLTELTVFSGYSVATREALVAQDLLGLYDTRNWQSLAIKVIRTGSGSDLSWFYLGRAAEELGYFPAAKFYFEQSVIAAKRKGISGCIACSGFKFPEDSVRHLAKVEARMNKVAP